MLGSQQGVFEQVRSYRKSS